MPRQAARLLRSLQAPLLLFLSGTGAEAIAGCVEPASLMHSTVSITKHFSEAEKQKDPTLLGIRGTAWFLSPQLMATAAHVAASMDLSDRNWKEVEIADRENRESLSVRLHKIAGADAEKIALLALSKTYPGAQSLPISAGPLSEGLSAVSLGYPSNRLRFAAGRFVKYGDGVKLAGTALFELSDGDDRLALDHGASGAPVLDCGGRVVAVVTNIFVKTLPFMSQSIRVSTAWGSPNIAAVPIDVLERHPGAE